MKQFPGEAVATRVAGAADLGRARGDAARVVREIIANVPVPV